MVVIPVMLLAACGGKEPSNRRGGDGAPRRVPAWASLPEDTTWDKDSDLPTRVIHRSSGIAMRLVPPGRMVLGVATAERVWQEEEAHAFEATRAFYLGEHEVTWEEFERSMGKQFAGQLRRRPREPVFAVPMRMIDAFCEKHGLRLPSEDEWEYACRWGTEGLAYGALDEIAVFGRNICADVGTKRPNALGLYDMIGNSWEVCEPRPGVPEGKIVARGGGVDCQRPDELRATTRDFTSAPGGLDGFRVACDP